MAASDDDDPVVQEIDVFLSKQLAENLYLFQYPVRPAHMTYDNNTHLAARIKPGQQKVELEMSLDTRSPNYARSKGEQIALNVDGEGGSGDMGANFYTSDKMDKQVLSSVPSGISTSRYVVGTIKDGELHITPLKGVIQMRPGFSYLDRVDSKHQLGGMPGSEDKAEEDEEEPKAVTVRFARRETDEAKARRMASFSYVNKKWEEEPWIHMRHNNQSSRMAESERNYLFARQTGEVTEFQVTPQDYLQKLVTKEEEEESEKPPMPNNVLSMAELKTMTLQDQIRALMCNAKVMRFAQLMSLLTKGADPTSALRCLQQVALMIQGCWVVKSDVLYPKDTLSPISGVPSETLGRARDYVMWRFTQNRIVIRKDISTVVKVPAEEVKDILEQMARLKVNKGWEFLFEYDSEFINRHPEVVQRQQMLWDAKFQQLSKTMKISKADLDRKAKSDELAAAASPERPKRRRTISRSRNKSGSVSGMSDLSDSDMDIPKDRSRRQSGQSRSRKNSGRGELPTKADVPPPEPQDLLAKFNGAQSIMNGEAMETEATQQADIKLELEAFVSEKLRTRYVIPLSDLKTLFDLNLATLPSGHILGTGVSEKMLEQAVLNCNAVTIQYQNCEPIFVLTKAFDGHDGIREIMIDMLKEKPIRAAQLKKRMEESLPEVPPENVWRKILKDYCVNSKTSVWYLKGSLDVKS